MVTNLLKLLMQILLKIAIAVEHRWSHYCSHKVGKHGRYRRVLGAWFLLFLGKFSLEDLPLVEDLAQRGLLVPAKITPRYLADPAAGDRLRDAARADDLLALVNA